MKDAGRLRIAVSQWPADRGLAVRTDQIASCIDEVAGLADLIVLPELALTGYRLGPEIAELAVRADGAWWEPLAATARRAGAVVVVGFPERDRHAIYNSAIVIDRDGTPAGVYRKTHLFGDEARWFRPGDSLEPVRTSVGVIGVLICYDLELPEAARTLACRGATVFAVPTANMEPYGAYHDVYRQARAMENALPLAVANYVGSDGRFEFLGRSAIVSAGGEVLAHTDRPRTVVAAVDRTEPRDPWLRYLEQLRPALYVKEPVLGEEVEP